MVIFFFTLIYVFLFVLFFSISIGYSLLSICIFMLPPILLYYKIKIKESFLSFILLFFLLLCSNRIRQFLYQTYRCTDLGLLYNLVYTRVFLFLLNLYWQLMGSLLLNPYLCIVF